MQNRKLFISGLRAFSKFLGSTLVIANLEEKSAPWGNESNSLAPVHMTGIALQVNTYTCDLNQNARGRVQGEALLPAWFLPPGALGVFSSYLGPQFACL